MNGNNTHRARKRFGQNFLQDQNVINRIVQAMVPEPGQHLVEIGPGHGALTKVLLKHTDQLDVIELDRDLSANLQHQVGQHDRLTIHQADALKFDFSKLAPSGEKIRVLGNLPYNISTPLLFHLLEYCNVIDDMLFMLQLEVVERMAATPGNKNYGRLSVMLQYFCKVEQLFKVPATAFSPVPKVESAIVKLTPHTTLPYPAKDPNTLSLVVRTAFSQRRKTLRNSLKSLLPSMSLEALEIDGNLRAENISLREYVSISDSLNV